MRNTNKFTLIPENNQVLLVFNEPVFLTDHIGVNGEFINNDLKITNCEGESVLLNNVHTGEFFDKYVLRFFNEKTECLENTLINI